MKIKDEFVVRVRFSFDVYVFGIDLAQIKNEDWFMFYSIYIYIYIIYNCLLIYCILIKRLPIKT